MELFCPLAAFFLFLLIRPSGIFTQSNGYNGYYPAGYSANGYYPYYYGNGYGFCYVNQPYLCYNYIPPNFLPFIGPLLSQILRALTLPDLSFLLNAFQTVSPLSPLFLNNLQTYNPNLYNAYNQVYGAYTAMDPSMQRIINQMCATMLPAFQNAISSFNTLPPQSTPLFDQNFPQLANLLRSAGMQQFGRDPNPFGTTVLTPQQSPTPNIGQSQALNPAQQQQQQQPQQQPLTNNLGNPSLPASPLALPQNQAQQQQQQQISGGAAAQNVGGGGGSGLLNGILGAVSSVANAATSALGGGGGGRK